MVRRRVRSPKGSSSLRKLLLHSRPSTVQLYVPSSGEASGVKWKGMCLASALMRVGPPGDTAQTAERLASTAWVRAQGHRPGTMSRAFWFCFFSSREKGAAQLHLQLGRPLFEAAVLPLQLRQPSSQLLILPAKPPNFSPQFSIGRAHSPQDRLTERNLHYIETFPRELCC